MAGQNPLAAFVAQIIGKTAMAALKLNVVGSLFIANGQSRALNVTAAAVIKATPGRCARLIVVVAPTVSGAVTLNDCATTGAAATANQIWSKAYNATDMIAGAIFPIECPFSTGLVISAVGGTAGQFTIVYD